MWDGGPEDTGAHEQDDEGDDAIEECGSEVPDTASTPSAKPKMAAVAGRNKGKRSLRPGLAATAVSPACPDGHPGVVPARPAPRRARADKPPVPEESRPWPPGTILRADYKSIKDDSAKPRHLQVVDYLWLSQDRVGVRCRDLMSPWPCKPIKPYFVEGLVNVQTEA